MSYRAPVEAIRLSLATIGRLGPDMVQGQAGELSPEMLDSILSEAARFAQTRLAPQNGPGDKIGARFEQGKVTTPPGWPALYRDWVQAGWNGVDLPVEWGGMGLPTRLATAVMEIWTSACMAFALGPVLTQGAVDAIEAHADAGLKALYLPRLVSGEWTATMNLTEPQAGSDLGRLTTRAEAAGDGSYKITGNKIFITCGAHDLSENIVHLVLARLKDAPAGTRGISLFLVPQFIPDAQGAPGQANDVVCTGIEHKLGIHASPTCSMRFGDRGGATGWLVGAENRGLAGMFTMMNKARLYTGLQGVAIAERAYQQALSYARERRQGRVSTVRGQEIQGQEASLQEACPIIAHPDVRRMLLSMRALTSAGRALAHAAACAIDHAVKDQAAAERAGLLTPLVKAYCSEIGCEVTSLGVQVHGGMGYVEETGAAQHFRDARITPIYEGTNGIQAIDLVLRKVLRPGSTLTEQMIAEYRDLGQKAGSNGQKEAGQMLGEAAEALEAATAWLRAHAGDEDRLLGSATPYLGLFARTAALAGLIEVAAGAGQAPPALGARANEDARFFAENVAVHVPALARVVQNARVAPMSAFGE